MKSKIITLEEDLKTAFAIRKAVFVEEQGVPLEDNLTNLTFWADRANIYWSITMKSRSEPEE